MEKHGENYVWPEIQYTKLRPVGELLSPNLESTNQNQF
jgi:hypothetical protein